MVPRASLIAARDPQLAGRERGHTGLLFPANPPARNDAIDARDGSVDTVTRGSGDDIAKLDADDVIADATSENPGGSCERVIRGSSDDSDTGSESDCPKGSAGSEDGPSRRE